MIFRECLWLRPYAVTISVATHRMAQLNAVYYGAKADETLDRHEVRLPHCFQPATIRPGRNQLNQPYVIAPLD